MSRWVEHYGHIIIEFNANKIFKKNRIYPYNYGISEDDIEFYDMPFWEAEWRAERIIFSCSDINKIYIIEDNFLSDMQRVEIIKILLQKKIKFKTIRSADFPDYPESYFIEKYRERIKLEVVK